MLKQGNCVKRFDAVSTDKLLADTGESFLIRGLYVAPESDNDYLSLKIDRKTVGVYRIYGRGGNHLNVMKAGLLHKNLMEFLSSKGVNCTIPVAEGQSFSVASAGTSPVVVVVYDTYDAGDVVSTMPNGSDSKEYMFIQYMDNDAEITAAGDVLLNTSLSPAEFPDFPCGKAVPANTEIEILGLVGCPCGEGDYPHNYRGSSYVKMIKEREVLFDEDRNGLPFFYQGSTQNHGNYWSDFSLIGACVSQEFIPHIGTGLWTITLGNPLMFEPVLKFRSGEELLVYMSFIQTADKTIAAGVIDLAAIMNVKVS